MRLGPVHLIRNTTFHSLHKSLRLWDHFSNELNAAKRAGNPLAAQVLDQTTGLMHSPLAASFPPTRAPRPPQDDAAGLSAARRVVDAFHRATTDDATPPTASMWDYLGFEKADFLAALTRRDIPAVRAALDRMFVTPLTHGLGQVHESHPQLLAQPSTHLHFLFADTLVSLAEAVAAGRQTCMAQDSAAHLRPLSRDMDELLEATVAKLGFEPTFPEIGTAYGFTVANRLITIDSLTHAFAAYRLAQLGAGPTATDPQCFSRCLNSSTVYELGGGYGGLALMARRAGVGHYTIFDLPWVNVLQGYFLLRALPPDSVRLYGETSGNVNVMPYWNLYAAADRSCDWLVNSDSLPEMGHATAVAYLPHIRRVIRQAFLSINQEAKAEVPGVGPQNCVRELVDAHGGFRCLSRQRHWLRQGYVEEVFVPRS